jgi:hypothetical protein
MGLSAICCFRKKQGSADIKTVWLSPLQAEQTLAKTSTI